MRTKMKADEFKFKPARTWLGGQATERIEGWQTKIYEASGRMNAVTTHKVPHKPSSGQLVWGGSAQALQVAGWGSSWYAAWGLWLMQTLGGSAALMPCHLHQAVLPALLSAMGTWCSCKPHLIAAKQLWHSLPACCACLHTLIPCWLGRAEGDRAGARGHV